MENVSLPLHELRSQLFEFALSKLHEGHCKDSVVDSLTELAVDLRYDWSDTEDEAWRVIHQSFYDSFHDRLDFEREMMRERILKDRALKDNSSNVVQFKPKSEDWDDIPF